MAGGVSSILEAILRWWDELKPISQRESSAFLGQAPARLVLSLDGPRKRLFLEQEGELELLGHLIVKRKNVEPLFDQIRALGIEPESSGPRAGRKRRLRFTPLTAALMVGLVILAAELVIMRHQNALDALKARTEAARVEAAKVRLAVDASEAASARITAMQHLVRARLPVAKIIEELTAIMPDSAWVADLRINDDTVEFTGFAKSAASLIPLLAKSPLFTEASLTSPVILDTVEDKERFSVRLRLKDRMAFAKSAEAVSQAEARP